MVNSSKTKTGYGPWRALPKYFFFLSLVACGMPCSAQQKKPEYKKFTSVIKTNPFAIAWGTMPLTCEFRYLKEVATAKRQSLSFGFSYMGKNPIADSIIASGASPYYPTVFIKGFRMQFMYKMYFSKKTEAPLGWYTGPFYSYSTAKYSYRNYWIRGAYIQGTQWNLDWVIGKQARLGKHLCYDLFFGLGYKDNTWEYHSIYKVRGINLRRYTGNSYYTSHLKVCGELNLGWLF